MLQSKAIQLFALLSLFLLCCSTNLFSQEKEARLQGLLWEISGNNAPKTGYLYGTMHVPRKLAFNLSDTFFLALKTVDVVALETDHDVWQAFSKDMENFERSMRGNYGRGGFYDPTVRLGDLYGGYFDFSTPPKERFGMLLTSKPSMTNQLMYRSNTYSQEYEEDTYLDQFIFQAGKKLGKEVGGLETLEGSYGSAMRSSIPDEDEEERSYYGRAGAGAIEKAYRDQDLTKLDSLNKLSNPSKNFQKHMLDVRNIVHADGIDSVLQLGKAIFAGVGAAHLPGETGVIKLLRDKGYKVRPVVFTNTDVAFNLKKELEEMRYPVQFERYWSEDSVWTAEATGPFYKSMERGELEQHLSADMANGAYYAVYRLNTFGLWNGQTPEYIAGRIDSLIYEYTPGKIQKREAFSAPVPGHEITTLTRRGDIQRYKFFVMPNEVLLFSTGGIGKYAEGAEADRFMQSIQIRQKLADKGTYSPKGKGYRLDFPADLIVDMPSKEEPNMHFASAWDAKDSSTYFVFRGHYPDFGYIEEDTFELNIIAQKIAEQFTDSLPEMELVQASPYPTQDFSFKEDGKNAFHFGRLVIDGPAYYLLGSRRTVNERPSDFLESFTIQDEAYPQGFFIKKDTNLLFEVKTLNEIAIEEKPFFEEFTDIVDEIQRKNRKRYGEAYDESEKREGSLMLYDAQASGQSIRVISEQMKNFAFVPTIDSFKNLITELVSADKQMQIAEQEWTIEGDNHIEAEFTVRDTNSNRAILNRIIAHNGGLYRLVTVINADTKRKAFVDAVFSTFRSTDTVYAALPFGQRDLTFIENLYAEDSLIQSQAIVDLKQHSRRFYKAEDFTCLRKAIEHPAFDTLKSDLKEELIHAISGTETKGAVAFLRDFVIQHPDSASLRQTAILSISYIEKKYAYETFFELLENESIYMGDYFDFGGLDDSLELVAKFTDEILDIAQISEYRNSAIGLLHTLLKKGLIKPKKYRKLKETMRRDLALKLAERQFKAERNRNSKNGYYDYDPSLNRYTERNLELLQPFLKKDKKVRATFDYALKYSDEVARLAIYGIYLQEGIPINTGDLKKLVDDEKTHFTAYKTLVKAGVINQYTAWFSDTMRIVESMILNKESDIDSLQFISKHKAVYQNKAATLYFYDIKEEKGKAWGLAVVKIPNELATLFEEEEDYDPYAGYGRDDFVDTMLSLTDTKKETYIKKKIAEIRFVKRQRYRSASRYDYDYDNY